MPIELHCEHCGKLVQAPDGSGGKHGKCPSCHQTMYIPAPSEEIEPLELAPLDDGDEEQQAELAREAQSLDRALLDDADLPAGLMGDDEPDFGGDVGGGDSGGTSKSVRELLIDYALAMAAGNLEEADALAEEIHTNYANAGDVIQSLVADDLPPLELSSIPHPVLVGFFKQLSSKK